MQTAMLSRDNKAVLNNLLAGTRLISTVDARFFLLWSMMNL